MTIDDFEWVTRGFDEHILIHKKREMAIAAITHFNGWRVVVLKHTKGTEQIAAAIDNLDTAKVIAAIYVNRNMEGYPNANTYSPRVIPAEPKAFPKGVFKLD